MRPSGKRHPHQRRIPRALLEAVEGRLQGIGRKLSNATDFAALHRVIEKEIGGIKGVGALTVYDIAHRIGAHFKRSPERVYLHAGTRTGARVFNISGDSFDPKEIAWPFCILCSCALPCREKLHISFDPFKPGHHEQRTWPAAICTHQWNSSYKVFGTGDMAPQIVR